jgi:hypothetical protein
MRDLLKTVMTGSMVAGAALLVAACGGNADDSANNTAMTEMGTTDPMMDGTTNDVTAVDGATGMDANMAMDSNMTMDANMSNTMTNDMNATNGM